jgi:hypothetical protein
MPIVIQTQKVPPKATLDKQIAERKAAKQAKKAANKTIRKRKEAANESYLFGSELFEPIIKKEKEIVIKFGERFTLNRTRISLDGKFAFRQKDNFHFEFFYLTEPILEYEDDFEIMPSEKYWLFDRLTIEEVEDLAIKICRAEFASEKEKMLAEIRELEKERREELDKADEEFLKNEEEENERERQNITANLFDLTEQTSGFIEQEQKESEISDKIEEKEENAIPKLAKKENESSIEEKKTNIFIPTFRKVN